MSRGPAKFANKLSPNTTNLDNIPAPILKHSPSGTSPSGSIPLVSRYPHSSLNAQAYELPRLHAFSLFGSYIGK